MLGDNKSIEFLSLIIIIMIYNDFCIAAYDRVYESSYERLIENHNNKVVSDKLLEEFDREAQKNAIKETIIEALERFPKVPVANLWNAIYQAHLNRKSGISDIETIKKVISADQSWKKSSGHAFEEMIKDLASLSLGDTNIEIVLQRDLNLLIKAGELHNEPRDISWLREQIKSNIFDLFSLLKLGEKKYCFGCIQAKTSIRDRVTRDREPSIHAMQSFFWSAIFVLDGDFLRLPKFNAMVNGNSEEFRDNGWHGMYVLSAKEANDRIYPVAADFGIFKDHAVQAAKQWKENRQWLDLNWKAKDVF